MGIDLGDLVVRHPTEPAAYAGRTVAFDAWNILYQFLANIRQPDGTPLMDREGRVTSHLSGVLYRTANLVEAGIRPVFVFDGEPHHLKRETLAQRAARREAAQEAYEAAVAAGETEKAYSKAQQTSRLTPSMAEGAEELLDALGVPVVRAPADGEAEAAVLCAAGRVEAVCSQDFDALLYGAPRLLRNLTVTGRRKLPGKQVWVDVAPEEVRLEETLERTGLTRERLIDVALLVGTDFNPGIKGIGPKKALALIQREGGLEPLLERLAADPGSADSAMERALLEQHEALAERDEIRRIFLEPVGTEEVDLSLRPPDADAVRQIMVERHGFDRDRVDGALQRFGAARSRQAQQSLFDF